MRVLPPEHPQLVAEHHDLEVFGAVVTTPADHEPSHGTNHEGDDEEHRGMLDDRTGFSTPTGVRDSVLDPRVYRLIASKASPSAESR